MVKRILVVDDSPSWIRHHSQVLNLLYQDKIEIETAGSAIEANDKLYANADNPYDIILTDMQMESNFLPQLAGEWLIEQVQNMKEYYKTHIVIISATASIKLIAQKYNVDYIPKYNCREISNYKNLLDLFIED